MTIVERGTGSPIVLVPGIQGRWEYLSDTVDALAQSHRVITFSLSDEGGQIEPLVAQIDAALDDRGLASATICGVSFGGRVALRFAAEHPERTDALVLVSVPGVGWHLRPSHRWCARFPTLLAPLFFTGMFARLQSEIAVAIPNRRDRRAFIQRQLKTLFQAPVSPARMGARALLIDRLDSANDCRAIAVPTLVVTGEPTLDHVVKGDDAGAYAHLIAGARGVTLERTGHLGCGTRPAAFAALVTSFINQAVDCR